MGFRKDTMDTCAWRLVARYHVLDRDNAAFGADAESLTDPKSPATKAGSWALRVNWCVNFALQWALNHDQTTFDGGDPGGAGCDDEKTFPMRIAIGF